jgi:hypothetical protein
MADGDYGFSAEQVQEFASGTNDVRQQNRTV